MYSVTMHDGITPAHVRLMQHDFPDVLLVADVHEAAGGKRVGQKKLEE